MRAIYSPSVDLSYKDDDRAGIETGSLKTSSASFHGFTTMYLSQVYAKVSFHYSIPIYLSLIYNKVFSFFWYFCFFIFFLLFLCNFAIIQQYIYNMYIQKVSFSHLYYLVSFCTIVQENIDFHKTEQFSAT